MKQVKLIVRKSKIFMNSIAPSFSKSAFRQYCLKGFPLTILALWIVALSAQNALAALGQNPTVTAVTVVSGTTVDVTFSEPMGVGVGVAANYTVSGTGKGSLANNPNNVALQAGNTYRLTWAAGEMVHGGDITITVNPAVQDAEAEVMGAPNFGTDVGGGIGTLPTVTAVTVVSGTTADVTFSEPMGVGVGVAANYTVSGTGKGTLADNPNNVALQAGNTYRLTWAAGEMQKGGLITITVVNAQDVAGNPMGVPNSGTDPNPVLIPTLNEWGVIVFTLLLIIVSIGYIRRMKKKESGLVAG